MTVIVSQTPAVVNRLHTGCEKNRFVEASPVMVVACHDFDRAAVSVVKQNVVAHLAEHMGNAEEESPGFFRIAAPDWSRFDIWVWGTPAAVLEQVGAHVMHMNGFAVDPDKYSDAWMLKVTPDMADDFAPINTCWVIARPTHLAFDLVELIVSAELNTGALDEYLIGSARVQFLAYYKNGEGKTK